MHFSSMFFILDHFSPMMQHLLVGQALIIIEASRSHSDTPDSADGQPQKYVLDGAATGSGTVHTEQGKTCDTYA
jgi:hypothetical protein